MPASYLLTQQLTQEASQLLLSASASTPSMSDGLISSAVHEMLRTAQQLSTEEDMPVGYAKDQPDMSDMQAAMQAAARILGQYQLTQVGNLFIASIAGLSLNT